MCHPERRAQPEAEGPAVCSWPRQRAHPSNHEKFTYVSAESDQTQERKCVILNEGRSPEPKDLQFAHGRAEGASFESSESHASLGRTTRLRNDQMCHPERRAQPGVEGPAVRP